MGAEWADGAVPDAYAIRTLTRASEELRSDSETLAKEEIPNAERARLRNALGAARALADTLAREVRVSDRRCSSPAARTILRA